MHYQKGLDEWDQKDRPIEYKAGTFWEFIYVKTNDKDPSIRDVAINFRFGLSLSLLSLLIYTMRTSTKKYVLKLSNILEVRYQKILNSNDSFMI